MSNVIQAVFFTVASFLSALVLVHVTRKRTGTRRGAAIFVFLLSAGLLLIVFKTSWFVSLSSEGQLSAVILLGAVVGWLVVKVGGF